MLIIADKKIPAQAKQKLEEYGELVLLETSGITEESISGHPDIFFCKAGDEFIIAPNLPVTYKSKLAQHHIRFIEGKTPVGITYPAAAAYNAVLTENFLIHRLDATDAAIHERCTTQKKINVKQGFSRCSMLPLKNDCFITSDGGIYKTIVGEGLQLLYVSPKDILLPGQNYGFFGGTCGVAGEKVFILGSLSHFAEGEKVHSFLTELGYEIIELYDGLLFDGGSLLVITD